MLMSLLYYYFRKKLSSKSTIIFQFFSFSNIINKNSNNPNSNVINWSLELV